MIKIQSMPLNVVLQLVREQMVSTCHTTDITIIGVGFAYEYYNDFENDYPLWAMVDVSNCKGDGNNGTHPWLLIWDEDECEFHTIMRLDQNAENEKKDAN